MPESPFLKSSITSRGGWGWVWGVWPRPPVSTCRPVQLKPSRLSTEKRKNIKSGQVLHHLSASGGLKGPAEMILIVSGSLNSCVSSNFFTVLQSFQQRAKCHWVLKETLFELCFGSILVKIKAT